MLTYQLIPENESQDLDAVIKKVKDYLLSFVGEISIDGNKIVYSNTKFTASIRKENGKIVLTTPMDDSITVNLLKNVTGSAGFRIFSEKGYFLPNDPKLLDISSVGIDKKIFDILKKASLTPLFNYQNTLIFYCLNKNKKIVMTNRHYLEFLITNHYSLNSKELSRKVSDNVSQFIAMFDRGLIPLVFDTLSIEKLSKDTILHINNFHLDPIKQAFVQTDTTNKVVDKKYLYLKVNQDYSYEVTNKKLKKIVNISVYYE